VVRGHSVPVHHCGCDGLFSFHVEERLWGAYERLRLKNICLQLDILYQLGQAVPPLQFAGVRFLLLSILSGRRGSLKGGHTEARGNCAALVPTNRLDLSS